MEKQAIESEWYKIGDAGTLQMVYVGGVMVGSTLWPFPGSEPETIWDRCGELAVLAYAYARTQAVSHV